MANKDRSFIFDTELHLVELTGLKSRCGIKALLGGDGSQHTLRGLLVPYEPDSEEPPDGDDEAPSSLSGGSVSNHAANCGHTSHHSSTQCGVADNSGTDRPESQSREGGEAPHGEVWRGRGAKIWIVVCGDMIVEPCVAIHVIM